MIIKWQLYNDDGTGARKKKLRRVKNAKWALLSTHLTQLVKDRARESDKETMAKVR